MAVKQVRPDYRSLRDERVDAIVLGRDGFFEPGRAGGRQKATIAVFLGSRRSAAGAVRVRRGIGAARRQGGAAVGNELARPKALPLLAFLFGQPPFLVVIASLRRGVGKGRRRQSRRRGDWRRRNLRLGGRRRRRRNRHPPKIEVWPLSRQPWPRILLGVEFFFVGGRHQLGVFVLPRVQQPSHEGERHKRNPNDHSIAKRVR